MFKSKVIKIFDFRDAKVSEELLKIEVDQKEILKQLEDIARKYAVTVEPEDGIKAGDFVMAEMESKLEKYNKKNVPISIGTGLFNKGFEEKLLNIKKSEEKIIDVDGHAVKIRVLSIKRKIIPAVTDELIIKESMEGINSVQELKDYLLEKKVSKLKEERLVQIRYEVLNQIANQSEYLIVDEDIKALYEDELTRCRALAKMEGLVFEELSGKELGVRVGRGDMQQFKEYIKEICETQLKTALVGMSMASSEKIAFNEISYEEYIKERVEKEALDIEMARETAPFLRHVAFRYSEVANKKVSEYYGNKFRIVG